MCTKLHSDYYSILSCIVTRRVSIFYDSGLWREITNVSDCCALFSVRFEKIISSQKESAMILREHSDTYLRTIRIRSCNEIFNFNKKSSQIFVIMYAHSTTELRALFLQEITCLLRKSHQWFLEQLLLFFGRHWGWNLCSENTFLQKTGNEDNLDVITLRGYTSAKWSRQCYDSWSNKKQEKCNVNNQSPHFLRDDFGC